MRLPIAVSFVARFFLVCPSCLPVPACLSAVLSLVGLLCDGQDTRRMSPGAQDSRQRAERERERKEREREKGGGKQHKRKETREQRAHTIRMRSRRPACPLLASTASLFGGMRPAQQLNSAAEQQRSTAGAGR